MTREDVKLQINEGDEKSAQFTLEMEVKSWWLFSTYYHNGHCRTIEHPVSWHMHFFGGGDIIREIILEELGDRYYRHKSEFLRKERTEGPEKRNRLFYEGTVYFNEK